LQTIPNALKERWLPVSGTRRSNSRRCRRSSNRFYSTRNVNYYRVPQCGSSSNKGTCSIFRPSNLATTISSIRIWIFSRIQRYEDGFHVLHFQLVFEVPVDIRTSDLPGKGGRTWGSCSSRFQIQIVFLNVLNVCVLVKFLNFWPNLFFRS